MESEHLDTETIRELEDIMEDEFGALLETYLNDAVVKLEMLDSAVSNGDGVLLRDAAHSFKGASCNIGAMPLSRLCENVEHLAKDNHLDQAVVLIPQIRTEYEEVRSLLQAHLG